MAGYTNRAFRTICVREGAALTYTEMVSAKGLEYNNARTFSYIEAAPEETQLAVQLFGHEPDSVAHAALLVKRHLGSRLALIDINMGCPVRKVFGKGEGAALMENEDLAAEIVSATLCAVDVPVTAKFRSGIDSEHICAIQFAQTLEQAGASAITVHGRTAKQFYKGAADWEIIAKVKEAVEIPVYASGDVFSYIDALRMIQHCKVDGVMVARGARGNPWVFSGKKPSMQMRFETMRKHVKLYVQFEGKKHLSALRSQLCWYVQGLNGASQFRAGLSRCQSVNDYIKLINKAEKLHV